MDHDRQQPLQADRLSIEDRVTACEQLLAELRAGRAAFDRICVRGPDGRVRVVLDTADGHAVLRLSAREDSLCCVELFALDACDGEGAHIGIAFTRDGDVVSELGFVGAAEPRLWINELPRKAI